MILESERALVVSPETNKGPAQRIHPIEPQRTEEAHSRIGNFEVHHQRTHKGLWEQSASTGLLAQLFASRDKRGCWFQGWMTKSAGIKSTVDLLSIGLRSRSAKLPDSSARVSILSSLRCIRNIPSLSRYTTTNNI